MLGLGLSGCANAPKTQTIAQVIATNPDLSSASALFKQAGLSDTLNGDGPYTLFIASNDAFKTLPAAKVDALKDAETLKAALNYQIVIGKVISNDITAPTPMKTRPRPRSQSGQSG